MTIIISFICIAFVAFGFGYGVGSRSSDNYWASHWDGGSIYHRGRFFKVTLENEKDNE